MTRLLLGVCLAMLLVTACFAPRGYAAAIARPRQAGEAALN